jgi:segregation and condensation protein B
MPTNLPQAIEAILFATAEPQTFAFLAKTLNVSIDDIGPAVAELATRLEGHGIALSELNQVVTLSTKSDFGPIIETIRKDELSKELSKASAETLAVIAYTPGVSKSQIEFIRGVNVSYSLRALMMRGLIESKGQGRAIGYFPTLELLQHYGIQDITGLPDYAATKAKIDALLSGSEEASAE